MSSRITLKVRTHEIAACAGQNCVIHNPSDHHMNAWPIIIRLDRLGALAERMCKHGVGHPDPDSLAYITSKFKNTKYEGVHGCDGCCISARSGRND